MKEKLEEVEENDNLAGKKKPDLPVLSRLENLLQTEEEAFTGLLTEIFGSNHKEELVLETLCKLNRIKYDDEISLMTSKDYRDEITGADGTENHHWVQFASSELQTAKKTLLERFDVLKYEGGHTNLLKVFREKLKNPWLDIVNDIQDESLEIGIKMCTLLILLLFPLKKSGSMAKERFDMFALFLSIKSDPGPIGVFSLVNDLVSKVEKLLTASFYEADVEARWFYTEVSENKLDDVLRELGVFILNFQTMLSFELIPDEPTLMLKSLSFLQENLGEMKRRLTSEGDSKNTEGQGFEGKKTLEDKVTEVRKDFVDGFEEFLLDAIEDLDLPSAWKQMLFVIGAKQEAAALLNYGIALGCCFALMFLNI